MKAKPKGKKQAAKSASKKPRKPRTDHSQKRPVFAEFTNSWGLGGRKWWDTEACWFSQKIQHGKFLHPLLVSIVRELQRDFQCSIFQLLGSPHKIRESDVWNKEIWRLHQIYQKRRKREPLNQEEQRDLRLWLKMLTESMERMKKLGEIVVGAVACGDIALLEHLIVIMKSQGKPADKPANFEVRAIEKAYDDIVLRRQTELLQESNQGLKGVAARLAVARRHEDLLKQIQLPSASDVDAEITENPELKALAPEWERLRQADSGYQQHHAEQQQRRVFESNRRKIQRACKQTGRELSDKRTLRSR